MIYAVRFSTGGRRFIKFGYARDVSARLKALQTSSPWRLTLMGSGDWPRYEEKRIHAYLWEWRARNRSEWFRECSATDHIIALLVDPRGLQRWHEEIFSPASSLPPRLAAAFALAC